LEGLAESVPVRAIPDLDGTVILGRSGSWDGWSVTGAGGVEAVGTPEVLACVLADPGSMLVCAGLDIDLSTRAFLGIDLEAGEGVRDARVAFLTDRGVGFQSFPVWGGGRTSIVAMGAVPAWHGRLRAMALSFPDQGEVEFRLKRMSVSRDPVGEPCLYVRNLAPGRAKLRPGREEEIVAVVRSVGGAAGGSWAELDVSRGVEVLDPARQALGDLLSDATEVVRWRVRVSAALEAEARVSVGCEGGFLDEGALLPLSFEPLPDLGPQDYVPEPVPAESPYVGLMHYCPLWKEGTHYGWERIEPWPERRPAIGWYDEGEPEVADWHIKYALEHGIQAFIYCWYRVDFDPEINQMLGHAIHDGLKHARYRDRFRYCIMWENGCAKGTTGAEDLLGNLMPFWMENYFTDPSYLVLDNQPVLFVWQPGLLTPQLGGVEGTRSGLEAMRQQARDAGFDGLRIVGCVPSVDKNGLARMAQEGWDATSAYGLWPGNEPVVGRDREGIPFVDHAASLAGFRDIWMGKREFGALPDIPNVVMGWDPRPWHGKGTAWYKAGVDPKHFEAACRDAKELVDANPEDAWYADLVVFDNWTEFGEGHYLEPCSGFGFAFVDAIKRVFCTAWAPESVTDIVPEDVGLEPPEHVYAARRELVGANTARIRDVTDNLLVWYGFEAVEPLIVDSSACGFHGLAQGVRTVPDRDGRVMVCHGATVRHPNHSQFFPRTGITVSLWAKVDEPDQSDRWLVNTVGASTTGYRLGLVGGAPVWQVPDGPWSHSLQAEVPLPTGRWVHLAATYDNRAMRLYVNGDAVGEMARAGLIRASTADLCVGAFNTNHLGTEFLGQIDDVRIHDRALSAAELRQLLGEQP
jgi:hypothetical protein